jgi:glutamate synthase domain-containing protein 2
MRKSIKKLKVKKISGIDVKKIAKYGAGTAIATTVGISGAKRFGRKAFDIMHDNAMRILMTDIYDENLYEAISSTQRVGWSKTLETSLRANEGKAISRPMGSRRVFPNMDSIMFSTAQLHVMPTPFEEEIDVTVTIGKKAKKPLEIDIPIIIASMAYGIALSKNAKIALAKGASMAGTAIGCGEGPMLEEEEKAANKYIYQYHRGDWGKSEQIIRKCNAVEIQFGQGAIAGVGHVFDSQYITSELRKAYGYPKGKNVVAHSRQPEVNHPSQLPELIEKLKNMSDGLPIGAKIGVGKYLEADLEILCSSGVDFISIDGAEAATKGSPPILQDDFGVPTVFAISRTAEWLYKHNYKDRVSLIAGGKIVTPGDMLKACALGADACEIGTMALFAISSRQITKVMPYEPPTQLVWYHAKANKKLVIKDGAETLKNFLNSCKEEIKEGIKGLGKTKLYEVNKEDLMSLDEMIAKGCNIPMVYQPYLGYNDYH